MNILEYLKGKGYKVKLEDARQAIGAASVDTIVRRNRENNYTTDEIIKICSHIEYSPIKALVDLNILKQSDVNSNIDTNNETNKNGEVDLSNVDSMKLMLELFGRIELLKGGLEASIKKGES
jgi:hypothetical protein